MVMLAVIMVLSRILSSGEPPSTIKYWMFIMSISDNKYVILLIINVFLVIIGMLMDDVSGTLLCAPILVPIAISLGVSPYHMAAILGVNLGMGNVTPPTAPFLYLSSRICNVSTRLMLKPCLTIILFAYIPTLIITTYIPWVSLWLPGLIVEYLIKWLL
jgi:C4-dicarboxylate transporter DctM subunit